MSTHELIELVKFNAWVEVGDGHMYKCLCVKVLQGNIRYPEILEVLEITELEYKQIQKTIKCFASPLTPFRQISDKISEVIRKEKEIEASYY